MFNQDKYLSVTWLKGGRAYPELDCFGIVNEVRRDLGLHEWPDFAGVTKDDGGLDREAKSFSLTLSQCEPCAGAGVTHALPGLAGATGLLCKPQPQLHLCELCRTKDTIRR